MGLTQSTVGTTTGPDWATNAENNLLTIDAHDHTSGKGVQLTPSSLNINADLEFQQFFQSGSGNLSIQWYTALLLFKLCLCQRCKEGKLILLAIFLHQTDRLGSNPSPRRIDDSK